jgi:hypothetical protein
MVERLSDEHVEAIELEGEDTKSWGGPLRILRRLSAGLGIRADKQRDLADAESTLPVTGSAVTALLLAMPMLPSVTDRRNTG